MTKVLVIGAQSIDIFASTKEEYRFHDSNSAKIQMAFGGVGRNIAENLCRLGHQVSFISVFGDDHFSHTAKNSLNDLGIYIAESLFLENQKSSVYLGVMDTKNDLLLGLSDMEIIDHLNPEFFKTKHAIIDSFEIILIDNNLSKESLEYLLITYSHKNIIMDAVSAGKAEKLVSYLLKLNQLELDALTSSKDKYAQINELHQLGSRALLITHQENKVVYSREGTHFELKPNKMERIVNATGAGDAFLSGFVHGILNGFNDQQKLESGQLVAKLTLESPHSTSTLLSTIEID
jgi:pseudouridine kinase